MSLLERLMKQRGLTEDFLRPEYGEFEELPAAAEAAEKLVAAVRAGKKILIYGDYDADGVTASTVMREALLQVRSGAFKEEILQGGDFDWEGLVEVMLPDRFKDGYGMSERLVQRAVETEVDLVVTVDCGSNNAEIVKKLQDAGVEVVVTDHHEMLGETPNCIVVNPKRKDAPAPESLQDLAGVGVAFMVAYEMMKMGAIPEGQEKWLLDMVVIGTLCDSMRMRGANRALCFFGMKVIAKTRRVGLKELLERAGVKTLNSEAVGFQIGPRINAAGRMKTAELAFSLMNVKTRMEAQKLAAELEELNKARRIEQGKACKEISERGVGEEPVIVEVGKWHEGVLGIIAGRLTEDYKRPAFVLAPAEGDEELLKGSGRSFGEFNLAQAVSECQKCLVGGGGHSGACGVKVLKNQVDEFRKQVNEYYRSLKLENQERFLDVQEDLVVRDLAEVSVGEVEEMGKLEPYGEGNSEPIFLLPGMFVLDVRKMGAEEQHMKLTLRDENGGMMKAVAFFAPKEWLAVRAGEKVDIWVNMVVNEWNQMKTAEGRILKISKAGLVK